MLSTGARGVGLLDFDVPFLVDDGLALHIGDVGTRRSAVEDTR